MSSPPDDKLRVAVEGCGHGTLDAIYAAVEQSCEEKGWDGVDVLIIGGDFQATRNQYDLNVTAMPAKYREMVDFHQYYSGAKVAPCLTIFIGGNHEASNHLFELYYGGWVAPNIYYLGAANVLRLGNLRIAGLSGIWKGYDYRKPHYERLPYNQEDLHTIFHVRELDVRKLLAIRSQVDIGLSHDWPQTIEWSGDWQWLFKRKDRFQADAENGKLGNVAAKMVLDRLRPPYWFSAHLHIRYAATYDHESPMGIQTKDGKALPKPEHKQQLTAWQGFHQQAQHDDAVEYETYLNEQRDRQEEEARTGIRAQPGYKFHETFKQVTMTNLSRNVEKPEKENDPPTLNNVPQLDGSCASRPLKRPREPDSPEQNDGVAMRAPGFKTLETTVSQDAASGKEPQGTLPKSTNAIQVAGNPDELSIDLSSDDDAPVMPPRRSGSPFPTLTPAVRERKSEQSDDGGVQLNPNATDFKPVKQEGEAMARQGSTSSKSSLDPSAQPFEPQGAKAESPKNSIDKPANAEAAEFLPTANGIHRSEDTEPKPDTEEIPADIRAELEGLSKTFAAPIQVEVSPELPFPEEITNKKTEFLALDKCLPGRHFLELLEIESTSAPGQPIERPVKLQYDPEWLAILRAFAPELALGGNRQDQVSPHRGDTYYDERILEERKWVYQNVVSKEKLQVPDNFELTAPVYDPSLQLQEKDMPREVTNLQTSRFCQLIGIDNLFNITDEERNSREEAGPRAESQWHGRGRGGRHGGGRGGRGGGRGGRGGFGRGRGRGGRGRY